MIILSFEWFYNHPSLRYGGFSLLALIVFIPFAIYISKFVSIKFFKQKIIFLIVLSLVIFVGRNINRINNEIKKYDYNLFSYPYYYLDNVHFRVDKLVDNILLNHQSCIDKNKKICEGFKGISVSKKKKLLYLKKE